MARGRDETSWRRRTAEFAVVTILVALAVALPPFAMPGLFGTRLILGLPAAMFLAAIAIPVALLGLAAFFARWQLAIDRHHDISER